MKVLKMVSLHQCTQLLNHKFQKIYEAVLRIVIRIHELLQMDKQKKLSLTAENRRARAKQTENKKGNSYYTNKEEEGEHKHQRGLTDKPVSPPAVAHMTTGRIYLCVQGGGPSIHKQNFEFITTSLLPSSL